MCGIAGYSGFNNKKLLEQFSKELKHRGPDGEGYYFNENIGLLSRRLAIIDRTGGDQPIYNEDKTIAVVFNGEIYDYQKLTTELEKKGHTFRTRSDTETIIHLYEEKGEECFAELNGMFGLAMYDEKKKKLILARDQFGIKPLYYTITKKGELVFSSEIKPILHSGMIETSPNNKILYRYLRYRIHDDSNETFFENIYKLLPGEMMIVENGKHRIKKYWDSSVILNKRSLDSARDDNFDEKKYISGFYKKLEEAVKIRLVSEVPVGTSFSGGLDSSTVVTIVNKLLKEHIDESKSVGEIQNTFSAIFPGKRNDEERYVDAVTEKVGAKNITVHKIKPTTKEFFEDLMDFVKTQEEPTISTGPYAQYQVMRVAKKSVTVLLDGQGSDEMMAGYVPYYFVYFKQLLKEGNIITFLSEIMSSLDILFPFIKQKFETKLYSETVIHPHSLLQKDFIEKNKSSFTVVPDNMKKRLYEDIFKNSLQSLLRYEDKNTMRFSIEGRVPFLDINILKYIFSLPDKMIIHNGWNKFILRQSVKDLLPKKIVDRRNKIGFTTPEYEWFLERSNDIRKIFESSSFAKREYFNQKEVLKKWDEFVEKKNTDTLLFWRLLNTELWLRTFFD